ncbi:MAG: Maf family protein [Candidatus Omnitrophota bacterium]|jgi:septum formation protein
MIQHPEIILASASQRREKLLREAGLIFKVVPSWVEEQHHLASSCPALVKHNALLKANDIASRLEAGIVIAADTLVLDGDKNVVGKPRHTREAAEVLRRLCRLPHWVYTGVAVVDVAKGRRIVDYEKTKVFMQPLSADEISRYHQKTSPLDKAGGYNIEGWGGLFIYRIEGSYTNVIGLPMAKLRMMLKQCGVSLL